MKPDNLMKKGDLFITVDGSVPLHQKVASLIHTVEIFVYTTILNVVARACLYWFGSFCVAFLFVSVNTYTSLHNNETAQKKSYKKRFMLAGQEHKKADNVRLHADACQPYPFRDFRRVGWSSSFSLD